MKSPSQRFFSSARVQVPCLLILLFIVCVMLVFNPWSGNSTRPASFPTADTQGTDVPTITSPPGEAAGSERKDEGKEKGHPMEGTPPPGLLPRDLMVR